MWFPAACPFRIWLFPSFFWSPERQWSKPKGFKLITWKAYLHVLISDFNFNSQSTRSGPTIVWSSRLHLLWALESKPAEYKIIIITVLWCAASDSFRPAWCQLCVMNHEERDLRERQCWCQWVSEGKESNTATALGKKTLFFFQWDSRRETDLLAVRQWRKRQQIWQWHNVRQDYYQWDSREKHSIETMWEKRKYFKWNSGEWDIISGRDTVRVYFLHSLRQLFWQQKRDSISYSETVWERQYYWQWDCWKETTLVAMR